MLTPKKTFLNSLLDAEKDARQLRSANGKVIASNAKGAALFGDAADPFVFLKEASSPLPYEKLQSAYAQKSPVSVRIETMGHTYQVSIQRIAGALLLVADDISEEIELFRLMRHDHATLQESIDALPVGFYMSDAEGNIRFLNQTFADWLNAPREKLKAINLRHLIKAGAPDTSGAWNGTVVYRTRGRAPLQTQVYQSAFDQDGETMLQSIIIRSGAEEELSVDPLLGQSLFDKAPIGILTIDALDMTIESFNPAFLKLIGRTSKQIKETSLLTLLDAESKEVLPLKLSKLLMQALKSDRAELNFELATGGVRSIMAFIAPIANDPGEINSFILYLTESSERKNLEMQMAHAQKMQAMGQLAGGVAHDFNNLLTAIIGFADLLLQKHKMGDPSFADIMQIRENANRASGLVKQLLAFSRKQPLKPQLLDIADAFSELTALIKRSIGPKIELKTEYESDLGAIKVDPTQLTQVFLNLAVNARDAMPDGGTLTIQSRVENVKKSRTVGSDVMIPGSYVVFTVSDTGYGIAKENLGRIFEPFFSTKEGIAGSGTGLGLSTVYGIVTQTDGYINVDSKVGKGTTFTIHLPRFDATEKPKIEPKSKPSIRPLSNATVLLVDDEHAVRAFASRALKNKGFHVIECADGESAMQEIEKGTTFDLLLTDMIMPGMDGETLAGLAKERYPNIKVILMSGYSEDFARHGKDESQTFSFLPKPFNLVQLTEKVRDVLNQKG